MIRKRDIIEEYLGENDIGWEQFPGDPEVYFTELNQKWQQVGPFVFVMDYPITIKAWKPEGGKQRHAEQFISNVLQERFSYNTQAIMDRLQEAYKVKKSMRDQQSNDRAQNLANDLVEKTRQFMGEVNVRNNE